MASDIKAAIEDLISGLLPKKGTAGAGAAPSMSANQPSSRIPSKELKAKVAPQQEQPKTEPKVTTSSTEPKRSVQQGSALGLDALKQLTSEQDSLLKGDDRLLSSGKKQERLDLAARVMGFKDAASCDVDQLRRSYKKMALQLHPDRNPQNREESGAQFAIVGNAYQILCKKLGI